VSANVDFGDAMLAASAVHDAEGVASFDGDFDRFPDVTLWRWTTS
jgi:predicted nucleic acid-binding protein